MTTRNPLTRRSLLLATPLLACGVALAQAPAKAIRIVVPFAAGGPADSLARALSAKMSAELGQPLIVDNRSGAGGTLGAGEVARAAADGHTLLFSSTGALVIFPALSPKLSYDAERDLVAVGQAVTTPMVFVTAANSRLSTLGDMVQAAKARPGQLNYASAGSGTTTQLGIELLKRDAGLFMTHIPYRGAAPAVTDLLAGSVDLMLADLPAVLGFVKSGKLKALALAAPQRSAVLPEVPTTAESGYKGVVSSTWYGLLAPAKTPPEAIARLNAALNKALQQPDIVALLKAQGVEAVGGTPAAFAAFIHSESVKLGGIARAVGAKLD